MAGNKIWAGGFGGVAGHDAGWQILSSDLSLASVSALCYASGWLVAGGPEGIARSADSGYHWETAMVDGVIAPVACLATAPDFDRAPAMLAATIGEGVLRSENAGRTWKYVNFGLQNYEVFWLSWRADDVVLAATADGIYRSNNGGRAWRAGRGTEGYSFSAVVCSIAEDEALAALDSGGLLRSRDGGSSWQADPFLDEQVQVMAMVAREDGSILLGTANHGTLCLKSGQVETLHDASVLAFALDGSRVAAGLPDGVSIIEGNTISRLPAPPLQDLRVLSLHGGNPLAAGLYSGVWLWRSGGWEALDTPGMVTALVEAPDGSLVLSGTNGLQRSTDDGHTWQSSLPGEAGLVTRLTFRPDGNGWAGSANSARLLHTRDNGQSWKMLTTPFGVLSLVALQAVPDRLFAATYNQSRLTAQLWYSLDDGNTWERGAEARTNWPIVATCGDPAMVALGGTVFLLQADGTWGARKVGEKGSGVLRLASDGKTIMALTSFGLLRTVDRGVVWTLESDLPPQDKIMDIAIDGDRLFLLLNDGQVWARIL